MARFTEDMGRLHDEIVTGRIDRNTLIADTRQSISELKDSVESLQSNFREAHADMAEAGRANRGAFIGRLGSAVADIRVASASRQASFREDLAESAAGSRAERAQATEALRDEVAQLQDTFRNARSVMGMEVRAAGQSFVSNIVGAVADLQRQTVQLVGEFAGERSAGRQAWQGATSRPAAASPASAAHPKVQATVEPKDALKAHPKAAAHKGAAHKEPPPRPMAKPVEKPAVTEPQPPWGSGGGAAP